MNPERRIHAVRSRRPAGPVAATTPTVLAPADAAADRGRPVGEHENIREEAVRSARWGWSPRHPRVADSPLVRGIADLGSRTHAAQGFFPGFADGGLLGETKEPHGPWISQHS